MVSGCSFDQLFILSVIRVPSSVENTKRELQVLQYMVSFDTFPSNEYHENVVMKKAYNAFTAIQTFTLPDTKWICAAQGSTKGADV